MQISEMASVWTPRNGARPPPSPYQHTKPPPILTPNKNPVKKSAEINCTIFSTWLTILTLAENPSLQSWIRNSARFCQAENALQYFNGSTLTRILAPARKPGDAWLHSAPVLSLYHSKKIWSRSHMEKLNANDIDNADLLMLIFRACQTHE